MKKKLFLFSMMLLAAGIMLCPNARAADVEDDSTSVTLHIPTVSNVVMQAGSVAFDTTSIATFDKYTAATGNGINDATGGIAVISDPGTPDGYVQTNDVAGNVDISLTDGLDTTCATVTGGQLFTLTHTNGSVVQIKAENFDAAGGGALPNIGVTPTNFGNWDANGKMNVSGYVTTAAGVGALSLQLNLQEASLNLHDDIGASDYAFSVKLTYVESAP